MKKHSGGHRVGEGTYWNLRNGSLVEFKDIGILPGDEETAYLRIPFALLFLGGIFYGGLYIVFLPVTIIVMSVYLMGRRIFGGILDQLRTSVSFGWRPTEAYLAGKNKKEKKNHETKE
ncbi:MAG: hypothetical protein M0Z38_06610 [Deltaproteobacteria bacterium]|nr:hypothetical protein [Deltaproteobacteria bacterium]